MATLCPTCNNAFLDDDVSVAKDIAYCKVCDKGFALSDLVHAASEAIPETDLANPPKGAWYRDDGLEVRIGATSRSVATAGFFLVFSTFWNGITWTILIAMLLGSANVSGPGVTHTSSGAVVGITAYLFMIPFVLVGLGTALGALLLLFGRCEVTIRAADATLFRGLGPLGFRKHFDAASVTGVAIRKSSWKRNNQSVPEIVLDGPNIRFGSTLTTPRQHFIAAALKRVLQ